MKFKLGHGLLFGRWQGLAPLVKFKFGGPGRFLEFSEIGRWQGLASLVKFKVGGPGTFFVEVSKFGSRVIERHTIFCFVDECMTLTERIGR